MGASGTGRGALSRRELEVAALVAEGLTNRAIAERMFISERTVDGHLEHIREKLNVNSRAQVAAWFVAQTRAAPRAVAAPAAARVPRRPLNLLLPVAAVAVLVLVAGLVIPRLLAPATEAGSALKSYTGTTAAPFARPQAIAVSTDGFVYVADTDNFAIRKFDPKRRVITLVAGGKATGDLVDGEDALSPIGNPTGLAVAADGTIFFANGDLVGEVAVDRTVHVLVARRDMQPAGLALTPDGILYIADRAGNRVWRWTASSGLQVVAGGGHQGFGGDGASALDAELNHPVAVAINVAGDLLIADEGNNRIRQVDAHTGVITTIAGSSDVYGFAGDGRLANAAELSLPQGVAVAPNGDVFISDTGNNRVRRVGKDLKITTVAGQFGELYGPGGLAISPAGDLYIADIGDNKIALLRGGAAR